MPVTTIMAYKPPPELRSRVESIKKKFEVVEPAKLQLNADNVEVSSVSNDKHFQPHCRKVALKRVPPPVVAQRVHVSNENSGCENPNGEKLKTVSSYSGKGNIRRRPAFRCDKSVSHHQSSSVEKKPRSVVNNRVKQFEDQHQNTEVTDRNVEKEVALIGKQVKAECHSKAAIEMVNRNVNSSNSKYSVQGDTSLKDLRKPIKTHIMKSSSSKEEDTAKREKYMKGRRSSLNSMGTSVIDDNQLTEDGKKQQIEILLNETSCNMISGETGEVEKNVSSELCNKVEKNLTSSLRAALKAPLPPGPPPKKPPRTFVHNSPDLRGKSHCAAVNIEKSKFESSRDIELQSPGQRKTVLERSTTEPHIMLKKLESVLLKHQQGIGSNVIIPRTMKTESANDKHKKIVGEDVKQEDFSKKMVLSSQPCVPTNAHNLPKEEGKVMLNSEKLSGGCFESLNCVSNAPRHLYEKPQETRSEFFVESPLCSRRKNSAGQASNSGWAQHENQSLGCSKNEHIYAEPYACIDVETILKAELSSKEQKVTAECPIILSSQFPNVMEQKSPALHYMCSPIDALDRMDALLNSNNANVTKNTSGVTQALPFENTNNKVNDNNLVDLKNQERLLSQKSFLNLNLTSKSQSVSATNAASHKLDRSKVQLFINQAFGSPLHDSPVMSLDSASSDDSIPTTPDEVNLPAIPNEDEGARKKEENVASALQGDHLGENSLRKHQDMTKLTEERKVYVRRVSSRVFNTRQRLSSQPFSHLYHCMMLIGLNLDGENRTKVPYIKSKYPPNAAVPPLIEHLCFPDAADWPPPSSREKTNLHCDEQSYSLVITNEAGDHMFGYCRRVMPEGMDICLPLAYCILSPYRAKGFYFKILSELESQHGQPEWLQKAYIKELYSCEFPNAGQTLKLSSSSGALPQSVQGSLQSLANQLRRPADTRLEEHDLTLLFSTLPVPILLQVFGSLLLERKVLFISNSLSKLSSCIEALHSVLYPFSWQYTFIPVLPSAHIGVCEAPTPFIIGLLKDKVGKAPSVSLEEGIVIDLEESRILQCVGDESTILPPRLKKCLKMALQLVESTTEETEPTRNVLISEAFIRMFVEICGHYPNHIVTQQDGKNVFERESFIKAVPLRSVQLFLEWFTETAMFSVFAENHLNEQPETKGLFEQRSLEHTEEMDKNTMLFLRNYKAINKKVKSFGDRLKDWTPFT